MKKYYVGTSGWSYDQWNSHFYPDDIWKKEWLSYYSTQFNSVEVNSTYYKNQPSSIVKGWHDKVGDDFLFSVKVNSYITHTKKLRSPKKSLEKFYEAISPLGDKLGVLLFQLPPSFEKNKERLYSFLKQVSKDYDNVFEFRHNSWFCDEIYRLLEEFGVGFCVSNSPYLNPAAVATSDTVYFKWHGAERKYSSCYSNTELDAWAEKITKLKFKRMFGYFNNYAECFAPHNAEYLKQKF